MHVRTDIKFMFMQFVLFAVVPISLIASGVSGDPVSADVDADTLADMSEFNFNYNLRSLANSGMRRLTKSSISGNTCLVRSPQVLIIVSFGRSGSTAIANIIGSFLHVESKLSRELVGGEWRGSEALFF